MKIYHIWNNKKRKKKVKSNITGRKNEIYEKAPRLLIMIILKAHQSDQNLLKTVQLDLKSSCSHLKFVLQNNKALKM